MQIIEIKTLIDITNTKVIRLNQGTQLELDQNRNFITLRQCIELRSIVSYVTVPTCETVDIKDLGFGTKFKGKQRVWTFQFSPDRDHAYINDSGDEVGVLLDDLHEVPILKNLSETINIDNAIFDLKNPSNKNTLIKALQGTI